MHDEPYLCPERVIPGPSGVGDEWHGEAQSRSCSYCGSLHPDDFMAAVKQGARLTPPDKAYKVYVSRAGQPQTKFSFVHLSAEQKKEFVELYNARQGDHGWRFYVMPFFMSSSQVA